MPADLPASTGTNRPWRAGSTRSGCRTRSRKPLKMAGNVPSQKGKIKTRCSAPVISSWAAVRSGWRGWTSENPSCLRTIISPFKIAVGGGLRAGGGLSEGGDHGGEIEAVVESPLELGEV